MRSMVTSLFQSERITTTGPKAKEARRVAERLITRAKKGYRAHQEGASLKSSGKDVEARRFESVALAHWRGAGSFVRSTEVLRKLFDELAPHFMERNGGYTRIIRLDHRRVGDNAPLVLLELVDTEITKKPMIRAAVAAAAAAEASKAQDAKPARGRGKKKAEGADEPAKKEKKARPAKEKAKKESSEKAAEKARGKAARKGADAKKTAPAARSSKPKSTKKPGA
jgi:large subunit ribosomal protein L17